MLMGTHPVKYSNRPVQARPKYIFETLDRLVYSVASKSTELTFDMSAFLNRTGYNKEISQDAQDKILQMIETGGKDQRETKIQVPLHCQRSSKSFRR